MEHTHDGMPHDHDGGEVPHDHQSGPQGMVPYEHNRPHVQPHMPAYPYPIQAIRPKSAGVALLLGLFFPGIGNIYAGRPAKGVLILACTFVSFLSIAIGIGFLLVPACSVWGAWTANNDANRWNRSRGLIA